MSDGKKLLASVIRDGAVGALREIDESWLLNEELEIFRFLRGHYRRYGELPQLQTVESEMSERLPRADENIDFYRQKIIDRALYNELRDHLQTLQRSLRDRNMGEAKVCVDQMRASTRIFTPNEDLRDMREACQGAIRAYQIAHERPGISGIPSGWPRLDETTGGYQRGDLISWIARMGVGKTFLLLKQALSAWHSGYSVLVVTMEMTIEQIVRRMLGMEAGINPEYLRKGALGSRTLSRLQAFTNNMQHTDRLNFYAGGFSKQVSDVDMLLNELSPDIVLIDGAYLLKPSAKGRMNRLESVAEVYDELKRMTLTADRPIVTTSQFSRQAGKKGKDGSLENVAFSDVIGTHSSLVFSIKEGKPPYERTRRVIESMKGREGENVELHTFYQFAPINFEEVPEELEREEATNIDWMS